MKWMIDWMNSMKSFVFYQLETIRHHSSKDVESNFVEMDQVLW